jgi:hypothetical protein
VFLGPEEEKIMMTGLHKVCDLHCKGCMKIIGWTYVCFIFFILILVTNLNLIDFCL